MVLIYHMLDGQLVVILKHSFATLLDVFVSLLGLLRDCCLFFNAVVSFY